MVKKSDTQSQQTYQELSEALDVVLARLQAPDIQVDEAVSLYEEGLKLLAKLESVLTGAENTVKRLQLKLPSQEAA